MAEEQKGNKHEPQETLEVANEVLELVEKIKRGLEGLIAYPDISGKIDARVKELNQKAQELVQEALNHKKNGNTKESLLSLKKKKMVTEEVKKLEDKKTALLQKLEKEAGILRDPQQSGIEGLLSDPMYVGLKNAASDIKLGKRGKYKKETTEETEKQIADYYKEVAKENEDDLIKELENLEEPKP